jgi:hypothetical protein
MVKHVLRAVAGAVGSLTGAVAWAGVIEFEHDATGWMAAVEAVATEARAFDEFLPGMAEGGCVVDPPTEPVVLHLATGTITVSAIDGSGSPACPVLDGQGGGIQQSDGWMIGGANPVTLVLEFDPAISAWHSYYGSLLVGATVTMRLIDAGGSTIEEFEGPLSADPDAVGHGFVASKDNVARLEFDTGDNDGNSTTVLGAFVGIAAGESSLGTVLIPGYNGPTGADVLLDFAVVFGLPCPPDIDGDLAVGFSDLLVVLAQWGPCPPVCIADTNGDGTVGFADLLAVLSSWGPCSPR